MRGPRPAAIQVSPVQQALLERLRRRQTADQRLVRRASILLALAADPCVGAVARQLGHNRLTVRVWRDPPRAGPPPPPRGRPGQAPPPPPPALLPDPPP